MAMAMPQKRCGEKGARSMAGGAPGHEVGDEPGGAGRLGEAEMAMAEGVDHPRRWPATGRWRAALSGSDGRKPIHCAPPLGLSAGQEVAAPCAASPPTALKFGGRSSPPSSTAPPTRMPGRMRRDNEAMAPEGDLRAQVEGVRRQRGVVAALGLERDRLADRPGDAVREGAGREDDLRRAAGDAVGPLHLDTVHERAECHDLGPLDHAAGGAKAVGQRQREQLRVGDGVPFRREGAMGEARRQVRLQLGHLRGGHVAEGDAVLLPRLPARECRGQLRLGFVHLDARRHRDVGAGR